MRWKGRRQSENVEDRSGSPMPMAVGGGLGVMILALIVAFLGGDPRQLLQNAGKQQVQQRQQRNGPAEADDPAVAEMKAFVKTILADTEDVWTKVFSNGGSQYQPPKLVFFSGQVQSACGVAGAQTGPFYCPGDRNVYLDISFFQDLEHRFGAVGDFPRAYVVAHEVGHHIQNLMGTLNEVDSFRGRVSEAEQNRLQVKVELQADYLAGVWAHHMRKELEQGDIEEAIRCAAAIGDDRLQKQATGRVVPDSFTHGTSEQRARWFMKGFKLGDLSGANTFEATDL
jgi:predicted metalloprotease